jgi:hypothetical protein
MLRISSPVKSKHAQPIPTHVEIESTPPACAVVLATAAVAALLLLLLFLSGFDLPIGKSDRQHWHRMSDVSQDDQAYVMGKVLSGDAANADVVILGTSATREALIAERDLHAQLKTLGGTQKRVVNLSSGAQSPIETLLITEAIQPRAGQLFILFVSHSLLQQDRPFRAIENGGFMRAPDDLIAKYAQRGVFPLHWEKALNRHAYRIRAKRQEYFRHLNYRLKYWVGEYVYGQPAPTYAMHLNIGQAQIDSELKKLSISSYQTEFNANLSKNLSYVTNTLGILVDYLKSQRCRFVIAFSPDAKNEMRMLFPQEFQIFSDMLDGLQANHAFERVDLNEKIAWDNDDFRDLTHVNESGRIKWSNALVAWLARQPALTQR